MKQLALILSFFALFFPLSARQTVVTTASAINNGSWTAGDTIVMKNGTWTNQSISFKATGTASQPVVLMAQTPGQVILNGTSKLQFSGNYVTVNGLYFKNGTLSGSDVIAFRISSSDAAQNCRLTNCAIDSYNPSDNTVDSKWVSLYGLNNQVDHCSFVNKTNMGTLLVVWLTSGVTPAHIISDNYFGYRNSNLDANGDELNGQEIIRAGDSSTSMTTAAVTVSGNFFEHCNGEIETISNKSCGNLYTNNIFYECHGMLTLRHGNGTTVAGNYFFGNGVSDSGGVRVIGENHKVYNNYFEKLRGTGYRAALCIVRGKENSALNEYFQVKNATIEFNTMVDCTLALNVNYNSSSSLTMPPIGTVIAHNQVYNFSSSNTNVSIDQTNVAAMDVTWKNNLMNSGKYNNFSYNSSQVIIGKDPKMALAGTTINMYEPGSGSALATYATNENPDVTMDIRGRDRGSEKIPGCSQLSGTVTRLMPVKTEVGADFYNNLSTAVPEIPAASKIFLNGISSGILVRTSDAGNLIVFDMTGKKLAQTSFVVGEHTFGMNEKGLYVAVFETFKGEIISKVIKVD